MTGQGYSLEMPEPRTEPLTWDDVADLAEFMESIRADIKVAFVSGTSTPVATTDELYELMTIYGPEFASITWECGNDEVVVDVAYRSVHVTTKLTSFIGKVREAIDGLGYRGLVANIIVT